MGVQKIRLRTGTWFEEKEIDLPFPENWEVAECRMAGHDKPGLSDQEMRAALRNPLGVPRLSELAKGKHQVVILFDDLPKPTPAKDIVPFVLEELRAGDIRDDQIRFLCAPGTHAPLKSTEFVAKLGADIVARYPVYNHSIWENLVYLGTTSRGTPVHINREFAACDLRVAIGSLIPHASAGFGGGGKIVLPGIAGIETIETHHKTMKRVGAATLGLGRIEGNMFRADIEEAARLAGLHFKVDTIMNGRREVVGCFAGDFVATHRAAVRLAREVYFTEPAKDADVVVSNSYSDDSQWVRCVWPFALSLREGGDAVLLSLSDGVQEVHQLNSRFGTDFGGRAWPAPGRGKALQKAARLIVCTPHLTMVDRMELGVPDKTVWCKDWAEVLAELASYHGAGTKVAVYPYAPTQLDAASCRQQ